MTCSLCSVVGARSGDAAVTHTDEEGPEQAKCTGCRRRLYREEREHQLASAREEKRLRNRYEADRVRMLTSQVALTDYLRKEGRHAEALVIDPTGF